MDTCGSQTLVRLKLANNSANPQSQRHGSQRPSMVFWMVCLPLVLLLIGCATTIKYGSPPKVNKLETLKLGISNKSDILLSLGEPRGYGAGRYSSVPGLREIWSYEYVVSDGKKTSLKFLLVFFEKDLYDGYIWFSASELIDIKE